MNELIFVVEDAPEGGSTARALGQSIVTEADDLETLHRNLRDVVHCCWRALKIDQKKEVVRVEN